MMVSEEDVKKRYKRLKKISGDFSPALKEEITKALEDEQYGKAWKILDLLERDMEMSDSEGDEYLKRTTELLGPFLGGAFELLKRMRPDFLKTEEDVEDIDGEKVTSGLNLSEIEKKFKSDKDLLKEHMMTYMELHKEPDGLEEDFKDVRNFILNSDLPEKKRQSIKELYGDTDG